MRIAIAAAALSATCLFSTFAYSQPAAGAAPAPQVKTRLERAYRLKEAKKTNEAIAAFESVLKMDPQNRGALGELGYLHSGLKHWKTAVKYLAGASEQDPTDMRLRLDLGYARQSAKDYEGASADFAAVASQPGDLQAQAQQALEAAKGAAAGGPADSKTRRLLEQGYTALGKGDKLTAKKRFEAAAAADPKDASALKQLGYMNLEEGKLKAAAANFEAARAIDANDYFVALQLGYTYNRLRRKDQAKEAFNAALASTDAKIHDAAVAALNPPAEGSAPAAVPADAPADKPADEAPAQVPAAPKDAAPAATPAPL